MTCRRTPGWPCRRLALRIAATLAVLAPAVTAQAQTGLSPAPAGAEVYFVGLQDQAVVDAKLKLNFGLKGMGVAPAKSDLPNSGHHHLLIDTELPPLNKPIPNDFNHLHFGSGQTSAEIELTPGWHTLQLLLGDKDHVPHSPPVMSQVFRVKVVPPGGVTASADGSLVYFTDLEDGDVVQPEFKIHFGLRGMGVAPAGSARPNSGHHHLLVDTDLPDLTKPIPNDFNHLHYGSGQTETKVKLEPGEHTLQLLFADKDHIPHNPPLFSKKIRVVVAKPKERSPSAPNAEVYFVGLKEGATVPRKFTVHFGLSEMGVAPAGIKRPNTGHHHIIIDTEPPPVDRPIPNDFRHLHFGAGQTEATLDLPPGKHTLQLLLGDSEHVPHDPPVMSKPVTIIVK
ncbi:MAG: DUF4399 domain-containing protein [Hyphomicrobiaceae bacterium]